MKKLLCFVLATVLCLGSMSVFADVEGTVQGDIMLTSEDGAEVSAPAAESGITFSDVVSDSVLGVAIKKLVDKNILAGYPDGTFRPDAGLTRAELSKIINLVFNLTEKSGSMPFTDVPESEWYHDYVSVAVKSGYIKGFPDNTFRGDDPLTREQVCAIISRITKEQGIGLFLNFSGDITDEVSDWAVEDVEKIVANGIMPLEAGGKFRATENITRAELVLAVETFVVELPKVTVTFDTKGGEPMDDVLVELGTILIKPADPIKDKNTFKGWFTDEACKKAYDFNTIVMKDITLYAKWTPNSTTGVGGGSYTGGSSNGSTNNGNTNKPVDPTPGTDSGTEAEPVIYTVNIYSVVDGAWPKEEEVQVNSGECIEMPEIIKEGYALVGWYRDSAFTMEYDFSTPVKGNMNLYALFKMDLSQRVSDFTILKDAMTELEFEIELWGDLKDSFLGLIEDVIAAGEGGEQISAEYINENYEEEISDINEIYNSGMDDSEREEIKNAVLDMITICREDRGMSMAYSEIYQIFKNVIGFKN